MTYISSLKFIDICAGLGGFHLALANLGGECVLAAENDKFARKTYEVNHRPRSPDLFKNGNFAEDLFSIDPNNMPDFDLICAGFPCQPFSQAGKKLGFDDDRANVFNQLIKMIQAKQPRAYFFENVRHILAHDERKTFETIKNKLEGCGYSFHHKIVKALDHGLPQTRARVFMVGFRGETTANSKFRFPQPIPLKLTMSDIFGGKCSRDIGFTLRVGGRGSGIADRRNWDSYNVDGKVKRLSSVEGLKMMGLPSSFKFPVSEAQAMKQLGNSVAVPAIQATASNILDYIESKNLPAASSKKDTYHES